MSGHTAIESQTLTKEESAVLRCLFYFDVFRYPLTIRELRENICLSLDEPAVRGVTGGLIRQGLVKQVGEYYLCAGADEMAIERRIKGNAGAAAIMPTAYAYSRKIASYPFVRGVCLSGALSKNYFDEKGDIDYFIITKPGRLWICRTLLILRYKLLPGSKKKFWCVNYFVSTDNLEILDKNHFTATELAHLRPTYNAGLYEELLAQNSWHRSIFPNRQKISDKACLPPGAEFRKRFVEALFSGWGTMLDNYLLRATLRRWQKKYPDLNYQDFELQFRSRKNVCKRHTIGFQNKVLDSWNERMKAFEAAHNVSLA